MIGWLASLAMLVIGVGCGYLLASPATDAGRRRAAVAAVGGLLALIVLWLVAVQFT